MKKYILFAVLILVKGTISFGQSKNFIDQPYIEVVGYSDTLITPNLIYIRIVISEKDTRDKISVEEQENKMTTALKSLGINIETDLTTSDMLSNYKYYFLKGKDIIKTKEYILKVTTAEMASKIFVQLEDLGISNTSIQKLDHTEIDDIKNICRTRAVETAKKKALALTKPLSQTIGNSIFISDNEGSVDNQLQGRTAGIQIRGINSFSDKSKYEPPKIEFEKIKISSTIIVRFILK